MQRDFSFRKRFILTVLGTLLAADTALAIYSWDLASAPQTPQKAFDQQTFQLRALKGDIDNAVRIKNDMPIARHECDEFEQSLPPESTGYSSMTSEFDGIAGKSGLQIVSLTNKPKELEKRGLTEVTVEVNVNGDYSSVVKFVNGLQRSKSFYILDGLALSAEGQSGQTRTAGGPIRVTLHLRTYFRQAA